MTTNQIGAMVAPSEERLKKVYDWLSSVGVKRSSVSLSLHKDFMTVSMAVVQAEALLKTEFKEYVHNESKTTLSRAAAYHVPVAVSDDIDFVGGVIRFPPPKDMKVSSIIQRAVSDPKFAAKEMELRAATTSSNRADSASSASKTSFAEPPNAIAPALAYLHVGDSHFTTFVLSFCPSGQPSTSVNGNGCPSCANSVEYFSAEFKTPPGTRDPDFEGASEYLGQPSTPCGDYTQFSSTPAAQNAMLALISKNNYPKTAIFCALKVKNVPNFRTLNLQLVLSSLEGVTAPLALPAITTAPFVTPHSLSSFYKIDMERTNKVAKNSQSVTEFLGQYYAPKDLDTFFDLMGMQRWSVSKVIGPNDVTNPGLEASLDIQYLLGMSYNITTWFWSFGELHDGQEPFLQWLIDMSNMQTVPFVHSTSYADEEQSLTVDYMNRINVELAKQGLRGITLLFSAGDDGMGGYTMRTNPSICDSRGAAPEFPASSPYVVSVGGTQFSDRYLPVCANRQEGFQYECDGIGEIVSSSATGSRITSGGGFSINYARPNWQTKQVNAYFQYANEHGLLNNMPTYNAQGRAFPDISGIAHNYVVVIGGHIVPVDGTSASTPLIASMFAIINSNLIGNGLPPLGFVSPALYLASEISPSAFNDVVVGNNACSAYADKCCKNGFSATPGWDAASGLGTPNFPELSSALLGLMARSTPSPSKK